METFIIKPQGSSIFQTKKLSLPIILYKLPSSITTSYKDLIPKQRILHFLIKKRFKKLK